MSPTLLEAFLEEECTPDLVALMTGWLEAGAAGAAPRRKCFEFNLFEITIDLDEGSVLIEDLLEAGDTGAQRMSLASFTEAIRERRGTGAP